jgi:hypothetical protein
LVVEKDVGAVRLLSTVGVLLVNAGTPDATSQAVPFHDHQ